VHKNAKPAYNFHGKPFHDRLRAFLEHVRKTYSLHIRIAGNARTAEAAQRMHVCQMFLHNAFENAEPAAQAVSETGTISWEHFSDARVQWKGVNYLDVLRTKGNQPPEKVGRQWVKGKEPDYQATVERAKTLMREAGYVETAMVACGISPCGEPCGCTVGVSRHVAGKAADLNMHDLSRLLHKLQRATPGKHHLQIDGLLAEYGLYRPMLHHRTSPEPWHVEATPHHSPVTHKHHPAHHHSVHDQLKTTNKLEQCPDPHAVAKSH